MSASNRYQSQELYLQQGDVSCYRGTDPLTGLAVLIYTFAGRPTIPVGGLESENVPGILASSFDDSVGQVVTAYSPHYELVAPGESVLDDHFALEALRGVRDAAQAGVVHGDLRAGRLLYAQGHVLIEGYGVPWRPVDPGVTAPEVAAGASPSLAADVYAISATLLLLGGDAYSNEVASALRSSLAKKPRDRPAATSLYAAVRRACGGAVTPPPRSFEELTLPTAGGARPPGERRGASGADPATAPTSLSATRTDIQLDLDYELDVATPSPDEALETRPMRRDQRSGRARAVEPALAPTGAPGVTTARQDGSEDPEPITLHSDPGLQPRAGGGRARDAEPGFVKDLPPGATYRAGSLDDAQPPAPITLDLPSSERPRRRSWRGPLLVILALVAAGALASLAFLRQNGAAPTPSGGATADYLLSVQVQPGDLPPVNLYVMESPPGSATPPGTILCRAPCKIVLDKAGRWEFRGEFQTLLSKPATVKLPGPRTLTIDFPPSASGAARTTGP